jgi:maltooligosyltrehalose trehalohydrolase
VDASEEHILAAVVRESRKAAGNRSVLIVGENEPQQAHIALAEESEGYGLDLLWNDDFHHAAQVALTGRTEAYYSGYRGTPQEFISAAKYGYLYQGQLYLWQGKRRGEPALGLDTWQFVNYIQNHDQVANSARGDRLHKLAAPGRYRAMTALLLLAPGTPMLFQGQEFAALAPFAYFADHRPELAAKVASGRADFLAQFASLALPEVRANLPAPGELATFEACKLDLTERKKHAAAYAFHRDLLKLRREDPVFRVQTRVDGAVLGPEAFVLRFFGGDGEDRLLVVNLGAELHLAVVAEPLLAPPLGKRWRKVWSTEERAYGGSGMPPLETRENWVLPGLAAAVLAPADPSPAELEFEQRIQKEAARLKRERQQEIATERNV